MKNKENNIIKRIILFSILMIMIVSLDIYFNSNYQPNNNVNAVLASVNGGEKEAKKLRTENNINNVVNLGFGLMSLLVFAGCFTTPILEFIKKEEK